MKNMRKKSVAVLLGLAVTGLVGASAASLNGVDADSLGADVGVVGSCDTDGVSVAFNTAFEGGYNEVRQVSVSNVDAACDGLDFSITLTDGGAAMGARNGTADASGSFSANFGGLNLDAEDVDGVAITISGQIVTP